jgi:hypothetical protein
MNAIYSIFKHLTYTERQMLLTELNHGIIWRGSTPGIIWMGSAL